MAEIGDGYGSELLLLRYLGRHRDEFNREVLTAVGSGDRIDWLDFRYDPSTGLGDRELRGIEFLPADDKVSDAWSKIWPGRGNPQNWNAVGTIKRSGGSEWLLVEAKANLQEIESSCGADMEKPGYAKIAETFRRTKARLGVADTADWLNGYYQHANRLTMLAFLNSVGASARLLFIYFIGDQNPGRACLDDEAGWSEALAKQDKHLGIDRGHPLASRVHKLFLPARGGRGRKNNSDRNQPSN